MADQKKRRGRRAHLRDYVPDGKGGYEYRGRLLYFSGGTGPYRAYIRLLIITAAAMAAFTVAPECLPAVPVSRFPLTVALWLGCVITAGLSIYYVWKTAWGKNPIKEHIYIKSAARLPVFCLICACFSFALAAEEVIYLLINGLPDAAAPSIIRPAMAAACGAASLLCHLRIRRARWQDKAETEE